MLHFNHKMSLQLKFAGQDQNQAKFLGQYRQVLGAPGKCFGVTMKVFDSF